MQRERRRAERRDFPQPVNITTVSRKDRLGVARDLSATGMLFGSRSRFALGERVDLVFLSSLTGATRVAGRVVRTSTEPDPMTMWPHLTAVEFDRPAAVDAVR